jgi:NAD(P)-dependent dehydrogenase (short-subunit alcohol dehydrogenase family)
MRILTIHSDLIILLNIKHQMKPARNICKGEIYLRLANKKAIVTGSSLGIGAGIAKALAKDGADVIINYNSSEQEASEVCRIIREMGREAYIFKANVGDFNDNRRMVEFAVEKFGRVDILVNNAGISLFKPFFSTTEEIWDKTMDINIKSVFMLTQMVGEIMKKNGGGTVVNISSAAARGAEESLSAYCASKGAMTTLTMALAVELGQYNIRVNAIGPGAIDIKRNRDNDPDYVNVWRKLIPLGRVGLVDDVSAPVVFLCCDESKYITGQLIYVDGGLTSYVPTPVINFEVSS